MKKTISILLVLAMICTLLPTTALAQEIPPEIQPTVAIETSTEPDVNTEGEAEIEADMVKEVYNAKGPLYCGENVTWTLDDAGTLTISGTGPMDDFISGGAPWSSKRDKIRTVIIGEGVTTIGESAFDMCEALSNVMISNSVTTICDDAFDYCDGLRSIVIPAGVTAISGSAFSSCEGMKAIDVSEDNPVYSSLDGVLFNKDQTELYLFPCGISGTYIIPDGVTTIGSGAFRGCADLTGVTLPDGVTTIGSGAFLGCADLTGVTLPDGVTTIGMSAFFHCEALTAITIPTSVTTIGSCAFALCSALRSVTIPENVSTIGNHVFYGCSAMQEIHVSENNPNYSILNGVLYNKDQTRLIVAPGAFSGEITVPASVTAIASGAFADCTKLTRVTFLGDAPTIEIYEEGIGTKLVFAEPSVYGGVYPPLYYPRGNESWTESVQKAFGYSLIWIAYCCGHDFADADGDNLCDICGGSNVLASGSCGENLTWVLSDEGTLTISGTGPMDDFGYDGAPWRSNRERIRALVIEDGVTTIGEGAFRGCSGLTEVALPDSLTAIGKYAFRECYVLPNITIPKHVTSIGKEAFLYCIRLESITLLDSVTYIADQAFADCLELAAIHVSQNNPNYSSLDGVLFNKDQTRLIAAPSGLSGVFTIPASVTSIADCAFRSCTKLARLIFQGDPPSNEGFTFGYGNTPELLYYPSNNEKWTESVRNEFGFNLVWMVYCCGHDFADADGDNLCDICGASSIIDSGSCGRKLTWTLDDEGTLTISGIGSMEDYQFSGPWFSYSFNTNTLVIEDGVTTIGEKAFSYCTTLTKATLPDSITAIGGYAFDRCSNLTSVVFTGNAPSFGEYVFEAESRVEPIKAYYPANNSTWTEAARPDFNGSVEWIPYEGEAPDVNGTPDAIPGDMSGDGKIDETDVACLLWYTLFPDLYEISGNADFNGDGRIDDADVAYLLWHTLFPNAYPL